MRGEFTAACLSTGTPLCSSSLDASKYGDSLPKARNMINVLFWNVGREPRQSQIVQLANHYDVDIVLLAEFVDQPDDMLKALNETKVAYEYSPGNGNTKISVFTRFADEYVRPVFETDRLTIRRLDLPGKVEILLAVVQLPSKLFWSDESQAFECTKLAADIRDAENNSGHRKTVLLGDFNMNPVETGIVSALGIHAVMDRRIALGGSRFVQDSEYIFFYNRMWSFLGDCSPGPPGTLYYQRAEHRVYFWNMFDQVLIRPALLDRFRIDGLAIIDHNGAESLLADAGRPNARIGSDHLPIRFRLSL
jgi:endonuclease/exonuclease/phosphatase family metal-dependent hydrolase